MLQNRTNTHRNNSLITVVASIQTLDLLLYFGPHGPRVVISPFSLFTPGKELHLENYKATSYNVHDVYSQCNKSVLKQQSYFNVIQSEEIVKDNGRLFYDTVIVRLLYSLAY